MITFTALVTKYVSPVTIWRVGMIRNWKEIYVIEGFGSGAATGI